MRSSYLRFRLLLWNISDKMAFRVRKEKENRLKKHSKVTAELFGGSSKSTTISDDKTIQCHAPIVGCVRKGHPLPDSTSEGGVKMRCTNEKCEFARQLIHSECFEMLENHLIKIISNIGSARGWTELQRRHNLWEKKGLTLVQKLLRCKCDRGQMVRDTNFYKEVSSSCLYMSGKSGIFSVCRLPKVKDIQLVAKSEEQANNGNKLKKKKKKELPRLNFGYNSAVLPPLDNSDLYKKKFNELESHFLSSHYDNDDLSSVALAEPVCQHKNNNNNNNNNGSVERCSYQILRRQKEKSESEMETNLQTQGGNFGEESPSPPNIHHYLESERDGNNELNSSGSNDDVNNDIKLCSFNDDNQFNDFIGLQDLSSFGLSFDGLGSSLLSSCSSMGGVHSFQFQQQSPSSPDYLPVYTLFGRAAPSFFLGERILAEMYLPCSSLRG